MAWSGTLGLARNLCDLLLEERRRKVLYEGPLRPGGFIADPEHYAAHGREHAFGRNAAILGESEDKGELPLGRNCARHAGLEGLDLARLFLGGNEPQRELDILGLIVRLDDAGHRFKILFGHVEAADREPRDARAFLHRCESEHRTFVEREIAVLEQPGDRLCGRSCGDSGLAATEEEAAAEHQGAADEE